VTIQSQIRKIRGDIEICLNHCVFIDEEQLNIFNTDCLTSEEMCRLHGYERIVSVYREIRDKLRDQLPRTFRVTAHIEMELTGSRTFRVSHTRPLHMKL